MAETIRLKYEELLFHFETAFEDDPNLLILAGVGNRYRHCRTAEKMCSFYKKVALLFTTYRESLLDQGVEETQIDHFIELANQLAKQQFRLDESKFSRAYAATDRIQKLNTIWKKMKQITRAASIIWRKIPDEICPFTLPVPRPSSRKKRTSVVHTEQSTTPLASASH